MFSTLYNAASIQTAAALFACFLLVGLVAAETFVSNETEFNNRRTLSLGIVAFPGFEPLDIFGPLEIFFSTSSSHKITLAIIAHEIGPVSAKPPPHRMTVHGPLMDLGYMLQPTIMATHTFANAPALDVLLVPGGLGNRVLEQANDTSVEDFIRLRFDQLDYLLSVCTGALSLARAGVLNGRRATTNKSAWDSVVGSGTNVTWVPSARWVVDGKVWTSSGVSSGMDMTYAFLTHLYGSEDQGVINTMNGIEYAPHTNPHWDPFSIVYKIPGADMTGNVEDCVKPVGY